MNRAPRYKTFIRPWRKHRGLSLRALAEKLTDDSGAPLISYVSLGRIERGKQPYSQPVLEAVADALRTTPAALLAHGPEGADPLLTFWARLDDGERRAALAILEAAMTLRHPITDSKEPEAATAAD